MFALLGAFRRKKGRPSLLAPKIVPKFSVTTPLFVLGGKRTVFASGAQGCSRNFRYESPSSVHGDGSFRFAINIARMHGCPLASLNIIPSRDTAVKGNAFTRHIRYRNACPTVAHHGVDIGSAKAGKGALRQKKSVGDGGLVAPRPNRNRALAPYHWMYPKDCGLRRLPIHALQPIRFALQ